jgi:hypothetical protein
MANRPGRLGHLGLWRNLKQYNGFVLSTGVTKMANRPPPLAMLVSSASEDQSRT